MHGSDEIIRIIVDYLKESAGDAMRVVRFIDAVDDDGETAAPSDSDQEAKPGVPIEAGTGPKIVYMSKK